LDELLSEHAFLAIEAMRKGYDGSADFQATAAALSKDTDQLSNAVASVYGKDAGKAFHDIWSAHIGYFVDYVKATASKDDAGKQKALKELAGYKKDFSNFLSKATGGKLQSSTVADSLQMHINGLLGSFNAYVAGDYTKSYELERESIHHMYDVGKALAWGIVAQSPKKFDNTSVSTPAVELRATLSYLLSEHVALATDAMQNGIDGSKDFQASAQALSENTADLTKAIASVYGKDAGKAFNKLWSDHIGDFVQYVQATAAKDSNKQKAAQDALNQYSQNFADFISKATGGRLVSADVKSGLQTHITQLLDAFNSYVGKDYTKTYTTIPEAYDHMYMTAEAIANAIVTQNPNLFADKTMPKAMPDTGLGGNQTNYNFELIIFAALLLTLGGTFYALQRRQKEQE
jgi:hypothetical protein